MRAVNLLPKDAGRASRRANPVTLVALVGGALVLAVLGGLFMVASSALSANEEGLARVQAELATLPAPATTPAAAPPSQLAAERAPRVAALSAALAERVSWDRVLRRFSLVLPDDVWLQNLTLTSRATPQGAQAAASGEATGFSITGRTYSHSGVARLLSRLAAVPDLERVQLTRSQRIQVGGQKVVEFTIVAGVRADGDAA
jgi:Tfp pilus assembly protein PilN